MLTLVSSEPAPVITRSDLPPEIIGSPATATADSPTLLDDVLMNAERNVSEKVLGRYAGHVSSAADELGLTRQGLYKKIRRLGINTSRFQAVGTESADARTCWLVLSTTRRRLTERACASITPPS